MNRWVFMKFQDYTMGPRYKCCANLSLLEKVRDIPGAIVECVTWKGVMVVGMAAILSHEKEYCLFDSFQGLPPVKEIDGASALEWQANKDCSRYQNNCSASEEEGNMLK
mgnify:CR=1 FL=1